MRSARILAASLLLTPAVVVLAPASAQAATPNCTDHSAFPVATSSDGDPIEVLLPESPLTVGVTTVCLLKQQSTFNPGVQDMQGALHYCHGYNIAVDGYFGSKTVAAVKDFQSKHGLTVDGIYGPNTAKKLLWDSFYGELSRHHVPGTDAGCRSAAADIKQWT